MNCYKRAALGGRAGGGRSFVVFDKNIYSPHERAHANTYNQYQQPQHTRYVITLVFHMIIFD